MSSIIERTYAVATLGIGRPDHSPAVAASKLIADTHQQTFMFVGNVAVPAAAMAWLLVYTVPVGYKLNLGGIIALCDDSIIQRVTVYHEDPAAVQTYILMNFPFDVSGKVIYGPESAVEVPAGNTLYVQLTNNDIVERTMRSLIHGFLERVS